MIYLTLYERYSELSNHQKHFRVIVKIVQFPEYKEMLYESKNTGESCGTIKADHTDHDENQYLVLQITNFIQYAIKYSYSYDKTCIVCFSSISRPQ